MRRLMVAILIALVLALVWMGEPLGRSHQLKCPLGQIGHQAVLDIGAGPLVKTFNYCMPPKARMDPVLPAS